MTTVTTDIPNDITLSHIQTDAAMQSARVVTAMARCFGVNVNACISEEQDPAVGDRKVLSFSFEGAWADEARRSIASFLGNTGIKDALIKPSQIEQLGDAPIKMDLDKLSLHKPSMFDKVSEGAVYNGMTIAARLSRQSAPRGIV